MNLIGGNDFKEGDIVTYNDYIYIINNNMAKNIIISETIDVIDVIDEMKIMENIISTIIDDYEIVLIYKTIYTDKRGYERNIVCLKINNQINYVYGSISDLCDWKQCIHTVLGFVKTPNSYVDGSSIYYKIQYFIDTNFDNIYFYDKKFKIGQQICEMNINNTSVFKIFSDSINKQNSIQKKHIIFFNISEICGAGSCFDKSLIISNTCVNIKLSEIPSLKNILILMLKCIITEENVSNKNLFSKIYDVVGAYVTLFIDTIDQTEKIEIKNGDKFIDKNIYKVDINNCTSNGSIFELKKVGYNIYNCTFKIPDTKKINLVFEKYFKNYVINEEYKVQIIDQISLLKEDEELKLQLTPVIIGTNTLILNYNDKENGVYVNDLVIENPFTVCKEFSLLENTGVNNNYYISGIFVSKPLEYIIQCKTTIDCKYLLKHDSYNLIAIYMKNIFNVELIKSIIKIKNSFVHSDTIEVINSNIEGGNSNNIKETIKNLLYNNDNVNFLNCNTIINILDQLNNNYNNYNINELQIINLCSKLFMRQNCLENKIIDNKIIDLIVKVKNL